MNTKKQTGKPEIAVILFAKNEGQHIARVIEELKGFLKELPPSELFIYDDSSDDTSKIAEKLGVTPLKGFHKGLGWAYYTALQSLSFEGKFQIFITLDADGQTELSELPVFYKEFQKGYDLVVGSRFLNKNSFAYKYPKINFFGAKMLCWLITIATFQKFTDSHGGMRIMTSRTAETSKFLGTHSYVQESLIEAMRRGFLVKEIPCFWRERSHGKSRVVSSYIRYARRMGGPLFIQAKLHWVFLIAGSLVGFFLQKPFAFTVLLLIFGAVELWKILKFSKNQKQLKYYGQQLTEKRDFPVPSEESINK